MTNQPRETVTELILSWRHGNREALDRLVPLVYDELRRVARARLKVEQGHLLQTTALVHEAYLRLVDVDRMTVHDRTHFFSVAARLMRQIVVDHARQRLAMKRGGGLTFVAVQDASPSVPSRSVDILALDEALCQLSTFDERLCRIVELKFFSGLTIDETADALDVSSATVERDWALAKAWLLQRLRSQ